MCPRLNPEGILTATARETEYLAATSTSDRLVKVLLKRAKVKELNKNQLLKRYSYFLGTSRKKIQLQKEILRELKVRHGLFGVQNLTYKLTKESQDLLKTMLQHSSLKTNIKMSDATAEGAGVPSQKIKVTDITNNQTTTYDSIHEAAKALNINPY